VRVAELEALVVARERALRKVAEVDAEIGLRVEELAADSPLLPAARAYNRDAARRRRRLETEILPAHVEALVAALTRLRGTLQRTELETARDFEGARVQLDHYATKAETLAKLKQKRDVKRLEKQQQQQQAAAGAATPLGGAFETAALSGSSTKRDEPQPQPQQQEPLPSCRADKRYARNVAKLRAARRDFVATTAAGCRVYATAVADRWHDVAPVLGRIVAWDRTLAQVTASETMPALEEAERRQRECPDVVPLESRIVAVRVNARDFKWRPGRDRAHVPQDAPPSRTAPTLDSLSSDGRVEDYDDDDDDDPRAHHQQWPALDGGESPDEAVPVAAAVAYGVLDDDEASDDDDAYDDDDDATDDDEAVPSFQQQDHSTAIRDID